MRERAKARRGKTGAYLFGPKEEDREKKTGF